jgi:hypothetical protein
MHIEQVGDWTACGFGYGLIVSGEVTSPDA